MSFETGVIVFLGAMLALVLFMLQFFVRRDMIRRSKPVMRVTGTVTGHKTSMNDGRRDYQPVVRFFAEGRDHETADTLVSITPQPPVGAAMEIEYPQDHPELARMPRHAAMNLMPYAVMLFMAGGLATMLAIMIRDL
jgi:hypothetical protein